MQNDQINLRLGIEIEPDKAFKTALKTVLNKLNGLDQAILEAKQEARSDAAQKLMSEQQAIMADEALTMDEKLTKLDLLGKKITELAQEKSFVVPTHQFFLADLGQFSTKKAFTSAMTKIWEEVNQPSERGGGGGKETEALPKIAEVTTIRRGKNGHQVLAWKDDKKLLWHYASLKDNKWAYVGLLGDPTEHSPKFKEIVAPGIFKSWSTLNQVIHNHVLGKEADHVGIGGLFHEIDVTYEVFNGDDKDPLYIIPSPPATDEATT